jgi:pumilio RNA-binding family
VQGEGTVDSVHDETSVPASSILKEQCDILAHQLESGHDSQLLAATALRGAAWMFAQDEHGCRVVQLALSKQRTIAESVTAELHGHVLEALASPHANFVIQRVVEVMPTARSAFVAEELIGFAAHAARHCYGCRILIRLLEHSAMESKTVALIDEFLDEVVDLTRHIFGHHVIQAVLEHGSPEHRHRIADALIGPFQDGETLLRHALHRNASRILEAVLLHCTPEDQSTLCDSLLSEPDVVLQGAQNSFGCYVLMAAIRHKGECAQTSKACHLIWSISDKLSTNKHGKRLLESLDQARYGEAD